MQEMTSEAQTCLETGSERLDWASSLPSLLLHLGTDAKGRHLIGKGQDGIQKFLDTLRNREIENKK